MNGLIWLTNVDSAEPVGVPLSKLVLVEQKRPQDGGAVTLYLDHGKEVQVSESLKAIRKAIQEATGVAEAASDSVVDFAAA